MSESTEMVVAQSAAASVRKFEPDNFQQAVELAKFLVGSKLAPRSVQSANDAFIIMATGTELGLTTMQSLRSIHVIEGKPVLSADLIAAICRGSALCVSWHIEETTDQACRITVTRRGDTEPTSFAYTIEDARRAGLLGKANWKSFPRQMLRARCTAEAGRAMFPEILHGVYLPEELERTSDDDAPPARRSSNVIDASLADPPDSASPAPVVAPAPPAEPTPADIAIAKAREAAEKEPAFRDLLERVEKTVRQHGVLSPCRIMYAYLAGNGSWAKVGEGREHTLDNAISLILEKCELAEHDAQVSAPSAPATAPESDTSAPAPAAGAAPLVAQVSNPGVAPAGQEPGDDSDDDGDDLNFDDEPAGLAEGEAVAQALAKVVEQVVWLDRMFVVSILNRAAAGDTAAIGAAKILVAWTESDTAFAEETADANRAPDNLVRILTAEDYEVTPVPVPYGVVLARWYQDASLPDFGRTLEKSPAAKVAEFVQKLLSKTNDVDRGAYVSGLQRSVAAAKATRKAA